MKLDMKNVMRLGALIEQLQELFDERGDMPVVCGDYSVACEAYRVGFARAYGADCAVIDIEREREEEEEYDYY